MKNDHPCYKSIKSICHLYLSKSQKFRHLATKVKVKVFNLTLDSVQVVFKILNRKSIKISYLTQLSFKNKTETRLIQEMHKLKS